MISVITWNYSRQQMYNITIPLLLKQEGVEFEIIAGIGPGITTVYDKRITYVITPELRMCKAYNALIAAAHGDMLFITQADMQLNSTTQLKRMMDNWRPRRFVSEKIIKNGKREHGIFAQNMLVAKQDVINIGGFCELYDGPYTYANEDSDFVATLMENGLEMFRMETPWEEGIFHIDHERPDLNDPVVKKRIEKSYAIYNSRHKRKLLELIAEQMLRKLKVRKLCV